MSKNIEKKKKEKRNPKRPRRLCRDCEVEIGGCRRGKTSFNIGYMLKNKLWRKVIDNEDGSTRGLLCITCAQLRLGRKVKPSDFKPVPLNLRQGGILDMLFPEQFRQHLEDFVSNGEPDEDE